MKMRKTICFMAAAVMAVSMAMTSCGNDDTGKEENSAAAAQGQTSDMTAVDTADKLRSDIAYDDELNELSADMIEKLYGISADKYSSGKVYIGSGGATAEEIACFDAVDETAAADIKTACETRISNQIKQFENYVPAELDKLNDPVLIVNGNSVYMCLSNDNAKAKEIIG